MNKWWLVGISLPAVAGLVWIARTSVTDGPAPARTLPTSASSSSSEVAALLSVQASPAVKVSNRTAASAFSGMPANSVDAELQEEPMQMKALQELLDKDPKAALVAAREGLARDPDGPDAAERTWVVVKALAVTGRFDEARREAEAMVPKFRGTRWADDVERHVLAHP